MSKAEKPVAKSLHTITVIVQVARDFKVRQGCDNNEAIKVALEILGLAGREDPYKLAEAAWKQLNTQR